MESRTFEASPILKYLGLPLDYHPSPTDQPVEFLKKHIRELPPQLLQPFSVIANAKERTAISIIRNRRLRYTTFRPTELSFEVAKDKWPSLWTGRGRPGQTEGSEEKKWVNREFLGGAKQQVGKLGTLLGDYAAEREAEQIRVLRRQAAEDAFVPEEDDDGEDSEEELPMNIPEDSPEELRDTFERVIRERFIYGILDVSVFDADYIQNITIDYVYLQSIDYDPVDWSDQWDLENEREDEERWFDEEEESEAVSMELE